MQKISRLFGIFLTLAIVTTLLCLNIFATEETQTSTVASVGSESYATLAEAIAEAQTGDTITLLADVEATSRFYVAGKKITIDLAGYTISGICNESQSTLIYVENNAELTVKDSVGTGKITYAKGSSNVGWTVDVKGKFVLESGTIELTGSSWGIGYAVDVRPNSWGTEYTNPTVFVMNGGKLVSSDGAVRVASSSADGHKQVSAAFVMNDGYIDAAWDGVFVQQSNTVYDDLSFTINGGTIESDLNPVRVYGPAPDSYVNDSNCMSITLAGGTMIYTGTETQQWIIEGILRAGGGSSAETIVENGALVVSEAIAESAEAPEGFKWAADENGNYALTACHYVAEISGVKYESLAEAIAAAHNGDTVVLLEDLTIIGETVKIADGVSITLDMNGKKITVTDNKASNVSYDLFYIYGGLTVTGNGTIEMNSTSNDTAWAKSSTIFQNRGGVLVIENGTFTHTGGTAMAYVVDNNANSFGDATTTIKGGTLTSTYVAIRNRMDTYGANGGGNGIATLNISGGNLSGKYAVWGHVSSSGVKGAINITGGTFTAAEGMDAVRVGTDTTGKIETAVSGGTFSSAIPENFCADGYKCVANGDGTYGVKETTARVSNWEELAAAIADVDITDIILTDDITAEGRVVVDRDLHIDLNEKTLYLTKVNNRVWKAATLTIDGNGIIEVSQVSGGNVFYVGSSESGAGTTGHMVLDSIEVFGDGYNTGTNAAVFMLYGPGSSTLDITNCELNLSNNRGNGSVFYDTGTNNQCKINIVDSTLVFDGTVRGSVCGNITIDNSNVTIKNSDNGFNEATLTIKNGSEVTIINNTGRGLTINRNGYGIVIEDSKVTLANNGEGDIRYKESANIIITNSELSLSKVVVDSGKNATINGLKVENGATVESVEGVVTISNPVAKIGDNTYSSLAEAIAAAQNGDTITLLEDIESTNRFYVAGKKTTIDLAGYTISGICNESQSTLIYVENNAELTVKDSVGTGKITYAKGSSNVGWTVDVKGKFVLESGTIELTGSSWGIGYAVDVRPNSWGTEYTNPTVFVMNGGKLVSSDGAVRVASSSADGHKQVSAAFVMNDGYIDAAWDGVFVQQSNTVYDDLSFTINGGTIESDLNPVRVYGPAPDSYVNDSNCMSITLAGGTMIYTGTETQQWIIEGILRAGGGSSAETIVENGALVVSEAIAESAEAPEGFKWAADENGNYALTACHYVAEISGVKYESLAEAIKAAKSGDEIVLLEDVVLTETLYVPAEMTLTINGNGKKLTPADDFITNDHKAVIALAHGDKGFSEDSNYTIKNLTFEGFSGLSRVIRANFGVISIENCVFSGNTVTGGVITSAEAELTVSECTFDGNTVDGDAAYGVIDIGSDVGEGTTVVANITNNTFINNKVEYAVLFLFSSANVSGNTFADNVHIGTNENGAAILAGPYTGNLSYTININGNKFVNAIENTNGDALPAVFAEDWKALGVTTTFNLSKNYWDGAKPVIGTAYKTNIEDAAVTITSYYTDVELTNLVNIESNPNKMVAYSLALEGEIAYRVTYALNEETYQNENAKVVFTFLRHGETVTVEIPASQGVPTKDGMYRYSVGLYSYEMTTVIESKLVIAGEEQLNCTGKASIKSYAEYVMASNDPIYTEELKELVKSMLNYGAYSQLYFKYNLDNLATDNYDVSSVANESIVNINKDKGSAEGIAIRRLSLELESRITLRYVFKLSEGYTIDQFTFKCGDDVITPVKLSETEYRLDIEDINVYDLDKEYTVVVNDSYSVTSSAISYASIVVNGSYGEDHQNLCKAMYMYNEAGNTYFEGK